LDVLGRLRCWPPQRNTTQILRIPSENRSAALSCLLRQADTLSPQSHCPGDPDDYALPDYVRHRYDDCLSTRVCRLSVAHDYYTRALLVDVLSTFNFDLLWRAGWGRCYYCTVIVTYDELLWQRNLESNGCYQLTHAHTAMCPSCRNQCVIDAVHLPESLAEQEIILHRLYDDIWQGDWTLLTYRVREHWRRLRLFVCYGLRLCKAYNQCARRVRDLGEQLARQEWQMTCEDLPSPTPSPLLPPHFSRTLPLAWFSPGIRVALALMLRRSTPAVEVVVFLTWTPPMTSSAALSTLGGRALPDYTLGYLPCARMLLVNPLLAW
jgi:hypothetical protein